MEKKTIRDMDVRGKRVFVRVDFNVPLDGTTITDDTRIRAALPTIQELRAKGARIILASHLGRPKGKVDPALSLRPIGKRLEQLVGAPVIFSEESIGPVAQAHVEKLQPGDVLLLENVRFHPGEEKNDQDLAAAFASLADVYVNDAFGTAHRAHATTEGIAHLLPGVAGMLMERELKVMGEALTHPERPFTAIIGGAKVSDKIGVIEHLLAKVDRLLIGGGMANTFLAAIGYELGTSLVETDRMDVARSLMEKAQQAGKELLLPVDLVLATAFAADAQARIGSVNDVQAHEMALDIGPETSRLYAQAVITSKTVIWNGPMGVFEMERFAAGTNTVAQAMAEVHGVTIIGGGDSVAAIEKAGLAERMTHISTGGGASLEFLEGKILPGVAVLQPMDGVSKA
ncbi:MAG: phosphoglycerate kinase [Acidibacillus sp.]|nr:phosphoglycerate kinase [Acidibacillus sp.]